MGRNVVWLLLVLGTYLQAEEIIRPPLGPLVIISAADHSTTANPVTSTTEEATTIKTETSVPQVVINDRSDSVIDISTGRIEGRKVVSKVLNKTYHAFQGIPYGQPPVGDLRFREPVPVEPWNGTLKTTQDGAQCVHSLTAAGSEDCLYLNVFTPKISAALLPVMVWIQSDTFLGVSPHLEHYGPDYFVNEDVVVVTFSYRVGIFGFLSTEDHIAPGNWGIKDQILALKWVQTNIDKFGGDPKNVTVFGQGAGAASISILIQSPLGRGLFHKAIMQSGTSLNQWAYSRHPRKSAFAVGHLLDIDAKDSRDLVEHLRRVDYRTLYVVSVSTDLGETVFHSPLDGLGFAPTTEVNHPGAVITNHSHSILKDGDFNRIPVVIGFNSEEALESINVIDYLKPYVATQDIFSTRLVPGSLNIKRNLIKILVAQMIRVKYFGWRPLLLSTDQLVQFVTDDQFARPIYEYITQSSKYAPTYFYIFSYQGPLGVDGKVRGKNGVAHREEVNYLWNKPSNIDNPPQEDILTRNRLVRLWSNFAKTGNPTPIQDDLLQNVTWPPTNVKTLVYLNINTTLEVDNNADRYSIPFWSEVFRKYGQPPFNTY